MPTNRGCPALWKNRNFLSDQQEILFLLDVHIKNITEREEKERRERGEGGEEGERGEGSIFSFEAMH